VLAKDWYADSAAVTERLLRLLQGEGERLDDAAPPAAEEPAEEEPDECGDSSSRGGGAVNDDAR
jgi:hypothetical protein